RARSAGAACADHAGGGRLARALVHAAASPRQDGRHATAPTARQAQGPTRAAQTPPLAGRTNVVAHVATDCDGGAGFLIAGGAIARRSVLRRDAAVPRRELHRTRRVEAAS